MNRHRQEDPDQSAQWDADKNPPMPPGDVGSPDGNYGTGFPTEGASPGAAPRQSREDEGETAKWEQDKNVT